MTEDHYVVAQLYSMTIPVSILAVMMAVIVYVQDLKIEPISELSLEVVAKVVFVVLLAATFISYAFALLFFFKYNRTMHWLNFLAMFVPTAWLVWRITSIMLLAYNIAIFTAYAILYREEHRIEKLSNCGILVAALALAWPASYLDEMSVWASLLALGCWDCFAVLISVGPFALILHEQQRRIWMGESSKLTPGLVYHSASGYDLGSGDLVVYAVLLLRSLMRRSLAVAFATLIGILQVTELLFFGQ